jgi:dihydroorotate dehydrogenase electron transfer subunit
VSHARGTIFLEDGEILARRSYPGDQHILRVRAPRAAGTAVPGTFAHIQCDATVPMRRPLSIMRTDADEGWLEFLYRPIGPGLRKLAARERGDVLSLLAPIGNGFRIDPTRPTLIAIGGGVGIPPMVFLAQRLRESETVRPVVLMGSEVPFPFELVPAGIAVDSEPTRETQSLALLESWGVPTRLASRAGLEGCFDGFVTELARQYLSRVEPDRTQLVACGPEPMLAATAALAAEFEVPCQLALEEFMACGIGGCAGCTVQLTTPAGPAMKRVCVDGPVFDAAQVYPRA